MAALKINDDAPRAFQAESERLITLNLNGQQWRVDVMKHERRDVCRSRCVTSWALLAPSWDAIAMSAVLAPSSSTRFPTIPAQCSPAPCATGRF